MFILTNNQSKQFKVINVNFVREFMITPSDGVQIYYENGTGTQIAQYENRSQCITALKMFAKAMEIKKEVFEFPSLEQVKAEVINSMKHEKARPIDGRKVKGHGGS